jgi:exodeoxyribonuclease-3
VQLRIATWNVNSLRVRLPHVLDWLANDGADVLGLQETKLIDQKFPREEIEAAGFHVVFAGQPTYNGVAILARKTMFQPPAQVAINNPLFQDEQVRIIAADLNRVDAPAQPPLRFMSVYVPNGAAVDTDKYDYKMRWLTALHAYIAQQLKDYPELAVVGDYNIAPEDRDVHDPDAWKDQVLCSVPERQHFQALLDLGFKDAFRLHSQPEELFSWWDYRQAAFRRNRGLRIDHLLLSNALAQICSASGIDTGPRKLEQPSDHAPAWASLELQRA